MDWGFLMLAVECLVSAACAGFLNRPGITSSQRTPYALACGWIASHMPATLWASAWSSLAANPLGFSLEQFSSKPSGRKTLRPQARAAVCRSSSVPYRTFCLFCLLSRPPDREMAAATAAADTTSASRPAFRKSSWSPFFPWPMQTAWKS
jgi:hypothetical protein